MRSIPTAFAKNCLFKPNSSSSLSINDFLHGVLRVHSTSMGMRGSVAVLSIMSAGDGIPLQMASTTRLQTTAACSGVL